MPTLSRPLLATLLLAGTFFTASALAEPGKEKLTLVRKTAAGDRISVHEHVRQDTTTHWKGEGQGSAGGQEVEEVEREFVQEIVSEKPFVKKRAYKKSTRAKGKPKDDKVEAINTSVSGKTVVFKPEGPSIEGGGEISKEDRDDLDTVEKIAYALLPPPGREVSIGDHWEVGDEVGRAVFGTTYDGVNNKADGGAKLESVKTIDGRKTAKLSLKASVKIAPSETAPLVEIELKGTGQFYVEEGVFRDLKLEGPIKAEQKKTENGQKVSWSFEGTKVYELKADLLSQGATKATKDDEIAKAKKLVCKNGHEYPNEFANCGSCGKALDPTSRRCPGGCAPLLRYCPQCGEALGPKE